MDKEDQNRGLESRLIHTHHIHTISINVKDMIFEHWERHSPKRQSRVGNAMAFANPVRISGSLAAFKLPIAHTINCVKYVFKITKFVADYLYSLADKVSINLHTSSMKLQN